MCYVNNYAILVMNEYCHDDWLVRYDNLTLEQAKVEALSQINDYDIKPENVRIVRITNIKFEFGIIISE